MSRTDRRRQGLRDQVRGTPRPGLLGRVTHSTLLDAGHAGRDADHHLGPDQIETPDHLADEVTQHRLGDQVVGDYTVLHRPDHADTARRTPDHVASRSAYRNDRVLTRRQRHDGRLLDHDALALDANEDVGGTKVDPDALGQHRRVLLVGFWVVPRFDVMNSPALLSANLGAKAPQLAYEVVVRAVEVIHVVDFGSPLSDQPCQHQRPAGAHVQCAYRAAVELA